MKWRDGSSSSIAVTPRISTLHCRVKGLQISMQAVPLSRIIAAAPKCSAAPIESKWRSWRYGADLPSIYRGGPSTRYLSQANWPKFQLSFTRNSNFEPKFRNCVWNGYRHILRCVRWPVWHKWGYLSHWLRGWALSCKSRRPWPLVSSSPSLKTNSFKWLFNFRLLGFTPDVISHQLTSQTVE